MRHPVGRDPGLRISKRFCAAAFGVVAIAMIAAVIQLMSVDRAAALSRNLVGAPTRCIVDDRIDEAAGMRPPAVWRAYSQERPVTVPPVRNAPPQSTEETGISQPQIRTDILGSDLRCGSVIDLEGSAVPRVTIALIDVHGGIHQVGTADDEGCFVPSRQLVSGEVLVVGTRGYATVRPATCVEASDDYRIIVASLIDVSGTVVDQGGEPLEGAQVEFLAPNVPDIGIGEGNRTLRHQKAVTKTDANGLFDIKGLPQRSGQELCVKKPGYAEKRIELSPTTGIATLVIALDACPGRVPLTGYVTTSDGVPIRDAAVSVDFERVETAADGEFRLLLPKWRAGQDQVVTASKPGYSSATWLTPGLSGGEAKHEVGPITIVLYPEQRIKGVLVRDGGEMCEGWRVSAVDSTAVMNRDQSDLPEAMATRGLREAIGLTDKSGSFLVVGLRSDRAYRLRAWNSTSLEVVESPLVPAGTVDYVMKVPARSSRGTISGQVRSLSGLAINGVRVRLARVAHKYAGLSHMLSSGEVRTNADGRFEFRDVVAGDIDIRFGGARVVEKTMRLLADEGGRDMQVEVVRMGYLNLDLSRCAAVPESIAVESARGERLRASIKYDGGLVVGKLRIVIADSAVMPEIGIREDAAWIVCLRGDVVTERMPVGIRPDGVVQVEYGL